MPNTAGGLPYPAATDPVAGGAAAIQALASAVDGLYPIADVVLAAAATTLQFDGIPPKYHKLIVELSLIPSLALANSTRFQISFNRHPKLTAANSYWLSCLTGLNGNGGSGVGNTRTADNVPLGIGSVMKYGGIANGAAYHAFIEIPFYWAPRVHAFRLTAFGRVDVSGAAGNDCNWLTGIAVHPDFAYPALSPITGLEVVAGQNLEPGSRMSVYGAGKLAPA